MDWLLISGQANYKQPPVYNGYPPAFICGRSAGTTIICSYNPARCSNL